MIVMVFGGFIAYSVCTPTARIGQGNIYMYPFYDAAEVKVLFVVGTWILLYFVITVAHELMDRDFGPVANKLFVEASYWAYLTHYFWIALFASIEPLQSLHRVALGACLFLLTELSIMGSWLILLGLCKLTKEVACTCRRQKDKDIQRDQN